MLDTSALIGLHEAHPDVAAHLAAVLEHHDDGTVPKTHQVVLGELWTGVVAVGDADDPRNPRRRVLDSAWSLDVETIDEPDAREFAQITRTTKRAMSHNDRWICAAAIRTRSTLITQDADMADQLDRYFAALELLAALRCQVRIVLSPRDPAGLAATTASASVNAIEMTAEVDELLSPLGQHERELLQLRFGLDRGEPRTLAHVAAALDVDVASVARIERAAIHRLERQ